MTTRILYSIGRTAKLSMLDLLLYNERAGNINMEGIQEEVDTFMFAVNF